MEIQESIINLLRKHANEEHQYINPNFLIGIAELLEQYFNIEDDMVDQWIQDMFGA